MIVFVVCLSLLLSCIAIALISAVAWRARRAHRGMWRVLEAQCRRHDDEASGFRHQWQLCYGRLVALEHGLSKPLLLTAQAAEDVFLLDYFQGRSDGTYVEVGAYDGIRLSNTYALSQLGWRGVLVEANPMNAARCRRNRADDIVEHCAVGGPDATGTVAFTMVEGAGGVDSLSFIGADASHLARCRSEGGRLRTVDVPFTNLALLLKRHAIATVDVLSMDIEGGELAALQGMDFNRLRPRLILVEANTNEAENDLKRFFAPLNYGLVHRAGMNLFFESGTKE